MFDCGIIWYLLFDMVAITLWAQPKSRVDNLKKLSVSQTCVS